MQLQELTTEQMLILQLEWGRNIFEIHTNLIGKKENTILVKPYLRDGKPVAISVDHSHDIVCNLFAADPGGQRVGWRNLALRTLELNGNVLYALSAMEFNKQSKVSERREHERIVIQRSGEATDHDGKTFPIMVHDISDNGISFFTMNGHIVDSQLLRISFSDSIKDQHFHLTVEAKVRHTKKEPVGLNYGCEIFAPPKDYLLYECLRKLLKNRKFEEETSIESETESSSKGKTESGYDLVEKTPSEASES